MMEVDAGYLEQTDYNVGRVVKAIEDLGQLDNTIVIYSAGDNGASAERSTSRCSATRASTTTAGWPRSRRRSHHRVPPVPMWT
jgi:arylsulfatase A-like enzyme